MRPQRAAGVELDHGGLSRARKSSWPARLTGLLAFGALAFGIFVAGRDTCAHGPSAAAGSYSQSTLMTITAAGSASPSLRESSCKRGRAGLARLRTSTA
ncbi:hypothetical protein [uncultured Variovorax sp.]|uniref:hypothetical protein n=1 Tax=uncultured Variovorax sp. TaxID=114708 RepID=UPI0025DA4201|nr:hypothetical protein [uncultured Variovorax sp.]